MGRHSYNWDVIVFALGVHLVIGLTKGQEYYEGGDHLSSSSNNYAGQRAYGGASDYGGGGGGYGSGAGYGEGDGSGNLGRPKLQLGLRVKIPAMKFELPRMSLPKITISAKIRQPNRPRTINLPEINLDTSSRVAAPMGGQMGGQMGGDGYNNNYARQPSYNSNSDYNSNQGGYAASASSYDQPQNSYQSSDYGPAKTQTFSISTSGEEDYGPPQQARYQNQQQQQQNSYHQRQAPPAPQRMNNNNYNYNNNMDNNHNQNSMHYSSTDNQPISLHPANEFFINQLDYEPKQPATFDEPLKRENSAAVAKTPRGLFRIFRMFRPAS